MSAFSVARHIEECAILAQTITLGSGNTLTFSGGTVALPAATVASTLVVTGATTLTGAAACSSTLVVTGALTATGGITRTGVVLQTGLRPKVGTSAGWVVAAGNNVGSLATMAAAQSGGTLVVYLSGLKVGDTITAFSIAASVNSAGNAVTIDANLRSYTPAAAATATDASIASITQISVTAATLVNSGNLGAKTGLSTVVATGVQYYILITATTAASTTIELNTVEVTVTTA